MEFFDALNLIAIPKDQNSMEDKLAVVALTLEPSKEFLNGNRKLEINFRPSIPNNMEHWQVFQNDEQILRFIHNVEEFSNFEVNFQEEGKEYQVDGNQFDNPVPRGLVSLEQMFNRQDRCKVKKDSLKPGDYIEVNIGNDKDPKLIKIGKGMNEKERKYLINLVREYRDVFAFTYDELKAYRGMFSNTLYP